MSPKKSIERLVKKYTQQSIVQQIGNGSTGSFQAVNSGRNAYVVQQSSHTVTQQSTKIFSSDEISISQAIELLEEIEKIVTEAASSYVESESELIEEIIENINWAKKEAQKKEPYKPIILANLEAAVNKLKKLN